MWLVVFQYEYGGTVKYYAEDYRGVVAFVKKQTTDSLGKHSPAVKNITITRDVMLDSEQKEVK